MLEFVNAVLFLGTALGVILGLTCIIMAVISDAKGPELLKERVEYGFIGISALAIGIVLTFAHM